MKGGPNKNSKTSNPTLPYFKTWQKLKYILPKVVQKYICSYKLDLKTKVG